MSRLELRTPNRTHIVMEELYKDLERRIESSPPGLCPVDMSRAFLELCHAQTCGKCVPCRIGLGQLNHFIKDVLDGNATNQRTVPSDMKQHIWCTKDWWDTGMTISSTSATEDVPVLIASRYLVWHSARRM